MGLVEAPMHEQGAFRTVDHRMGRKLSRVHAPRRKRRRATQRRLRDALPARRPGRWRELGERREPGGRDVAEIAGHVHQLMVAQQRDEPTPCGGGLRLQLLKPIEDLTFLVPRSS